MSSEAYLATSYYRLTFYDSEQWLEKHTERRAYHVHVIDINCVLAAAHIRKANSAINFMI